jgi:thymidylate kinase
MVARWRGQPECIVTDPHGKAARGAALSLLKIVVWLMEEWCFTLLKEKKGTLLLCDRYYHDILVDPQRYRFGAPMWMARWVGNLMPRPKLWILLDAAPGVLQARKQEVGLAESARQHVAYRHFIRTRDSYAIVDSSRPLDAVVGDVARAIAGAV